MKGNAKYRYISVIFIAAALLLSAAFSGCNFDSGHQIPAVTINPAFTIQPTQEPAAPPTSSPVPTAAADIPITFTDINFENAVREAIGRSIGYIYPADLADITSFSARVSGIVNIKEITYFTSLEELDLMGNRISDLSPLTALKNLRKLNISKNFSVMTGDREKGLDISPLASLPLLEELDASNNLITDISALGSLKGLRYLDIRTNRLKDLSGLEECESLEYLNISDSFRIDADNNEAGITDISALSGITKLKTLYMSNGLVGSLEPLSRLSNLEYIDATYNALKDFPNMSKMTELKTLIVRDNNIFSLAGSEAAPKLATLDVRNNYIRQILEVIRMPSIETILLDGNPVFDYSPLDIREAIRNSMNIVPSQSIFPPIIDSQPVTGGQTDEEQTP